MKGIQGQSEWMDNPYDRTIAEMNRRTNERNKGGTQNSSTDWQKIKPCKILKLFNLGQFGLEVWAAWKKIRRLIKLMY